MLNFYLLTVGKYKNEKEVNLIKFLITCEEDNSIKLFAQSFNDCITNSTISSCYLRVKCKMFAMLVSIPL